LRFDRIERFAHWSTAVLVLVLMVTGIILYVPSLSVHVGRRLLIEDLHVYVGVAVFVPLLISVCGSWGSMLRRDLASMNRLTRSELTWLKSRGRLSRDRIGKFNPGQKLNTLGLAGMLTVLYITGIMLRWANFVPVSWRTSATFTHDWFALAIAITVTGHILFAVTHPGALASMFRGWVTSTWIRHHAPAWNFDDEVQFADRPGVPVAAAPQLSDPAPPTESAIHK
jgi:formate dehydrogenase subunit gamma